MKPQLVTLATNNGDIGGGEIMLLALAAQLDTIGVPVKVVGPAQPSGLVDAAKAAGHDTVVLHANGRRSYMFALQRWRRKNPEGFLWCNGLVPSVASVATPHRIVHLHQIPIGRLAVLAALARFGALRTVVPSHDMSRRVPGTAVLENWVNQIQPEYVTRPEEVILLGFLGRPSLDKGVHVLADALSRADAKHPGRFRLVIAGEPRFVSAEDRKTVDGALAPVEHLVDRLGWMEPSEFFGLVDIMICPSIWPEPFGLVVAEAMSAKTPVIVSDAGALPEVVGRTHPWVAPAGDAEALANIIEEVSDLIEDKKMQERLELILSSAYKRWRDNYSPEAGRRRLSELLTEMGITNRA